RPVDLGDPVDGDRRLQLHGCGDRCHGWTVALPSAFSTVFKGPTSTMALRFTGFSSPAASASDASFRRVDPRGSQVNSRFFQAAVTVAAVRALPVIWAMAVLASCWAWAGLRLT